MVHGLYLRLRQWGPGILSPTEMAELAALANNCPFTEGLAVHQARTLWDWVDGKVHTYLNPCGSMEHRLATPSSPAPSPDILMSPNPASDRVTLQGGIGGSLVQVLSLAGQVMVQQQVAADAEECNIELDHLPAGLYIVRILTQDSAIFSGKLAIVH